MVGVAGRSKGCHTCRKRRVKCDEGKPFCHRCKHGGFDCLGYGRPVQFRHFNALSSAQDFGAKPPITFTGARAVADANVPTELGLDAFQPIFCLARFLDNFVWSGFGTGWIREAATGKLGSLSKEAMAALSQTNFGRQEEAAELRLKGAVVYGRTITGIIAELSKNGSVSAKDLVVPILVLVLHTIYYPYRQWEAFMSRVPADEEVKWRTDIDTDHVAALSHLDGLAKVVYICGPEGFQTPTQQRAFDSSRMLLTIDSLYKRKRIYLEEHRWRTTPWALNPASKSAQSKLLDFLAYIPGFLEDYGAIQSRELTVDENESISTPPALNRDFLKQAQLRDRIANVLQQLFQWRWEWQNQYGEGVKLEKAAKVFRTTPDYLGGQCLKFDFRENPNVRAADIALYNALLLWMIAFIWKLEPLGQRVPAVIAKRAQNAALVPDQGIPELSLMFAPLAAPGESVHLRSPALEILRVYEWQARNHHVTAQSTEPIYLYMFPFAMSMGILDKEHDIGEWVTEMAGTSIHTAAYKVGRFRMNGFARFITKAMLDPEPLGTV